MEKEQHTIEDIKEWLCEMGHEDAVMFADPDYLTAIVGISEDGRIIYSYNQMVKYLIDTDGMEIEDAIDFIDCNTIASLPYAGEMAPIVMYEMEI